MNIDKEDFANWKDNPVTEAFYARIRQIVEDAKADWLESSWADESLWDQGRAKEFRAACKARADLAEDIIERLDLTTEDEDEKRERDTSQRVQGTDPAEGRG